MKKLVLGLTLIMRRGDSRTVIIVSTLVFFGLLLLATNGRAALDALSFTALPPLRRFGLAVSIFFQIKNSFNAGSLLLAILGSFIGGINISLAYTYIRLRGEIIVKSGLYHGLGLVFAFLGIGCAACGTAFLSVLLGFFGFSTMLQVLPFEGQEIGYIGLIFLCIATYSLAQKITEPNVC